MEKNGLFVSSIGLIFIVLSATGPNMTINYGILVTGLAIAGLGAFIFSRGKKKNKDKEDK